VSSSNWLEGKSTSWGLNLRGYVSCRSSGHKSSNWPKKSKRKLMGSSCITLSRIALTCRRCLRISAAECWLQQVSARSSWCVECRFGCRFSEYRRWVVTLLGGILHFGGWLAASIKDVQILGQILRSEHERCHSRARVPRLTWASDKRCDFVKSSKNDKTLR